MWDAFATLGLVLGGLILFLVLFEPGLRYAVAPPDDALDSPEFRQIMECLGDAPMRDHTRIKVLTNGTVFYEAMLHAIACARRSVNLEAYIFRNDQIGKRFIAALAERAAAGVKVNLVIDAIGSFSTPKKAFEKLTNFGGRVRWYQPIRWYTLKRFNNRTHRELLVVDGEIGFIGGPGIGDNWLTGIDGKPPWRDTVVRVTGDLAQGLQTTFTENWLEAAEEILTDDAYFPAADEQKHASREKEPDVEDVHGNQAFGMVVISAPSAGRGTRARVVFQTLLASATKTIDINSPYFVPDKSVRAELAKAAKRGVRVRVIVPGKQSDHMMTRSAGRRRYGELLRAGIEIHEYKPAMIHVKALIVDRMWSVVGSTNFDNRSFGLNDEVNLAAQSEKLAARLEEDFENDLKQAHRVTLEEWLKRPISERVMEFLGRFIERQQ